MRSNRTLPFETVVLGAPVAFVLLTRDGRVRGWNPAAFTLFGPGLERHEVTCCELLGCGREGTPLADGCITRLARARIGPLPEIRVDLSVPDRPHGSAWVTAAELPGEGILVYGRPGMAADRRRRTEPHWTAAPAIELRILGPTTVHSAEGELSGAWLDHRPGLVLKYLALHRLARTEDLLDAFWPGVPERVALARLRQAVHTLRDRLEPGRRKGAGASFVRGRRGGYELDHLRVRVDLAEFEQRAAAGFDALESVRAGDEPKRDVARAELQRAVELYRGDLLADEPYAEWAILDRDRVADLVARALRGLAWLAVEEGALEETIGHLTRLADLQPLDIAVHRDLLRLMIRAGHISQARRRLEVTQRRYLEVLGEAPALALSELMAARDEPLAPPPIRKAERGSGRETPGRG